MERFKNSNIYLGNQPKIVEHDYPISQETLQILNERMKIVSDSRDYFHSFCMDLIDVQILLIEKNEVLIKEIEVLKSIIINQRIKDNEE